MAKLTSLATFLVALLILTTGSTAIRIITTTVVQVDDFPGESSGGPCQEQLKTQKLDHCQKYLFKALGRGYFSSTDTITEQQEKHLRPCCLELLDFDQECRCQAINQVLRQGQEEVGGSWLDDPVQEISRRAINIPDRCYIQPRLCHIFPH